MTAPFIYHYYKHYAQVIYTRPISKLDINT